MTNDTITATITIPAAAEAVFGVLADPTTHAAIDGTGNWIAINQLGARAGFPQYPYPNAASHPLRPYELLTRPQSDPLYVDVIVRRYEAANGEAAVLVETGETFEDLEQRRARERASGTPMETEN